MTRTAIIKYHGYTFVVEEKDGMMGIEKAVSNSGYNVLDNFRVSHEARFNIHNKALKIWEKEDAKKAEKIAAHKAGAWVEKIVHAVEAR